MNFTRSRPRLATTGDGRGVVARFGSRLLTDLAEATGLQVGVSQALASSRKREGTTAAREGIRQRMVHSAPRLRIGNGGQALERAGALGEGERGTGAQVLKGRRNARGYGGRKGLLRGSRGARATIIAQGRACPTIRPQLYSEPGPTRRPVTCRGPAGRCGTETFFEKPPSRPAKGLQRINPSVRESGNDVALWR